MTSTSTRRFFAPPFSVLLSAITLRIARIEHQLRGRAEYQTLPHPPAPAPTPQRATAVYGADKDVKHFGATLADRCVLRTPEASKCALHSSNAFFGSVLSAESSEVELASSNCRLVPKAWKRSLAAYLALVALELLDQAGGEGRQAGFRAASSKTRIDQMRRRSRPVPVRVSPSGVANQPGCLMPTMISTRRFCARPSRVALLATGFVSPSPETLIIDGATPSLTM